MCVINIIHPEKENFKIVVFLKALSHYDFDAQFRLTEHGIKRCKLRRSIDLTTDTEKIKNVSFDVCLQPKYTNLAPTNQIARYLERLFTCAKHVCLFKNCRFYTVGKILPLRYPERNAGEARTCGSAKHLYSNNHKEIRRLA